MAMAVGTAGKAEALLLSFWLQPTAYSLRALMIARADGVTRIGTELRLIAVARIRLKGAVREAASN
jgi:hypothetical protein